MWTCFKWTLRSDKEKLWLGLTLMFDLWSDIHLMKWGWWKPTNGGKPVFMQHFNGSFTKLKPMCVCVWCFLSSRDFFLDHFQSEAFFHVAAKRAKSSLFVRVRSFADSWFIMSGCFWLYLMFLNFVCFCRNLRWCISLSQIRCVQLHIRWKKIPFHKHAFLIFKHFFFKESLDNMQNTIEKCE